MPETITFSMNISLVLAVCGAIVTIATAIAWVKKGAKPILKPFTKMKDDLKAIESHQAECAEYFRRDKERLELHDELLGELINDTKILMEGIVLLMSHAETGNNTGEIAKGREAITQYLIDSKTKKGQQP